MEQGKKEYRRHLIKDDDLTQVIINAGHLNKLEFKGMSKGDKNVPIYYFNKCDEIDSIIDEYQNRTGKVNFESRNNIPERMSFLQFTNDEFAEKMIREHGLLKELISAKEHVFLENDERVTRLFYKFRECDATRKAWNVVYLEAEQKKGKDTGEELHD